MIFDRYRIECYNKVNKMRDCEVYMTSSKYIEYLQTEVEGQLLDRKRGIYKS